MILMILPALDSNHHAAVKNDARQDPHPVCTSSFFALPVPANSLQQQLGHSRRSRALSAGDYTATITVQGADCSIITRDHEDGSNPYVNLTNYNKKGNSSKRKKAIGG